MNGIGVVFDIDALGGGFYGSQAWRILMQNLTPDKIVGCVLREGDTRETLSGSHREFCIGIFGSELDVEAVKAAFAGSSEQGLASLDRRFILGPRLDSEPLVDVGVIDSFGRLVRDEWDRGFHDRCRESGWGFAPRRVTVELSPELKTQLTIMQDKEVSGSPAAGQPVASAARPTSHTRWWVWGVLLLIVMPTACYWLGRPDRRTTPRDAPVAGDARRLVSPDGRLQVRVDGEPGSQRLLLIDVSTGRDVVIHSSPGVTYLDVSFSADGDLIRFSESRANQPIVRFAIPALGGAARRIDDR